MGAGMLNFIFLSFSPSDVLWCSAICQSGRNVKVVCFVHIFVRLFVSLYGFLICITDSLLYVDYLLNSSSSSSCSTIYFLNPLKIIID